MEKVEKMSFLSKIFQNKKSCRKHPCKWTLPDHSRGLVLPGFNKDSVRLVIIVQHPNTSHGGRVLFDSKVEQRIASAVQDANKRNISKSQCVFTKNLKPPCVPSRRQHHQDYTPPSGKERRRCRLASDVRALEEMMFGSAPIIAKGSSLKVHTTRNPPQLMVTKLFLSTETIKSHSHSSECESFDLYSIHSTSMESVPKQIFGSDKSSISLESLARSVPVDVPMHPSYSSEENEDSGFSASVASSCSSSFTTSGYSPSSSASVTSLNSMTRRLLRSHNTSLDSSVNKRWSDDNLEPSLSSKRPSKLGVGITFTLSEGDSESFRTFEKFFFSHITLIESHVVKLKVAVEKALQKHKRHMVTEALDVFRNSLYDLYSAPRLTRPVWISMMQYTTHQVSFSQDFLKDFISVIDKYNSKNTRFFMSTLLTAVLTHHLAWVPTVTPAGAAPARTYCDKHSAKWLDALAKSHPYNPLWAQLGDLYGAIGFPLRQSRTVVVGQKADLVCKLLHILSYFIRCSEVQETTMHRQDLDYMDGHMDIPGMAMHTIEEDDTSESEEGKSGERMYGSATSFGTVRHISMQTSTETVLSTKSDGTVIERIPELRKGVSYCSSTSCEGEITELRVSGSIGSAGGNPIIYQLDDAVCRQCTVRDGDEISVLCNSCQEYENATNSLHKRTMGWQHGNSVFYCCQDIVDNSDQDQSQCNFDLCAQNRPAESCSLCDTSEESEEVISHDPSAETPVETEVQEGSTDGEDIIQACSFKPLKLFRMLSHDPTEGISGETTVCESSFCDKVPTEDCPAQPDPENSIAVNTPEDLFLLHDSIEPTAPNTSTENETLGIVISPGSGRISPSPKHEEPVCKLSPISDAGCKVGMLRVRHVGRSSASAPVFTFDVTDKTGALSESEHAEHPSTNLEIKAKEQCAKTDCDSTATEVPPLTPVPMMQSDQSECESVATQSGESPATGRMSTKMPQLSRPPLLPQAASSPSPSPVTPSSVKRHSTLYPSLQTLDTIPQVLAPSTSEDILHATVEGVNENPSPSRILESSLLENPSLLEEPGSVKLIKKDPGTLYPKISGNTIISSLTSDVSRTVITTTDITTGDLGQGMEVIRDTGNEDDVFIPEATNPDGNEDKKVDDAAELSDLSPTEDENRLGTGDGDFSGYLTEDVCKCLPPPLIPVSAEEVVTQHPGHSDVHENLTACQESSSGHDKVTAWLAAEISESETPQLTVSKTSPVDREAPPVVIQEEVSQAEDMIGKAVCTPLGRDAPLKSSQARIKFLGRSNSMFDEYFSDDTVTLPNLSEMEQKVSSSNIAPKLSHVDRSVACLPVDKSSCIHQQTVDKGMSPSTKSKPDVSQEDTLSILDEYFTETADPVTLPEGPSKDMVTTAISLMQESPAVDRFTGDLELNLADLIEASVEARSRSNSESSTSRSRNGQLERQHSSGSGLSRQNSLSAGGNPARCRSVTPTELSRRRLPSGTSNISWDLDSPEARNNMMEIPLPRTFANDGHEGGNTFEHNFGHSLIAGYTDHYMSDFILHGTSDKNFHAKLNTDLTIALQNSVLDEQISQACCIEADTDKMMVRLHSCQNGSANGIKQPMEMRPSQIVSNILDSVHKLHKLKMSPEFCLMHLEDRLQEIYFKSKLLSEYIRIHRKIDHKELNTMLGFDDSDLPLLLAVAGTHTSMLAIALENQS